MKRGLMLGAAALCVFVVVAALMLRLMPAPLKESDYMVIGSVATLLALGVFISGLNLLVWQLCVLGMFLAVSVPLIAWVEAASVLIFLLAAVIVSLAMLRLWLQLRSRPAEV